MSQTDPNLFLFKNSVDHIELPYRFNDPFEYEPHPLCVRASEELKVLIKSTNWNHNFGLDSGQEGRVKGKMYGVLVVQDALGQIGYLAAFSGKIGNSNQFAGFVPPVFDGLEEGGFLNAGMTELSRINEQIKELESKPNQYDQVKSLKKFRTDHSNSLQDQIYASYQLLNVLGEVKDIREIFEAERQTKPPGGAGECAAPKLLQYAFRNELIPLAIAEFWWGHSTKAAGWKHMQFYPACTHKCQPILKHMLKGIR